MHLLLQSLHPKAMRAVAEHSGYRGDMWGRLARTSTFLAITTFGHEDDAQTAVDVVRRIHAGITGTMPDGESYAASDPHLLTWVHCAEIDSFLLAHQTYGARRLDDARRDEYVAQTAEVARRLGAHEPPTTYAELQERLDVLCKEREELLLRIETVATLRQEAFMEAFHSVATHPQILPFAGDANTKYFVYGDAELN